MFAILWAAAIVLANLFKSQRRLRAENLFLRHQLAIALRRVSARPRLSQSDRAVLVWMTRFCPELLGLAKIVKPESILRWHRMGFRAYWRWKSRSRAVGRRLTAVCEPDPTDEFGEPAVGCPRIHGEFLKLGFEVAQSTVAKYMAERRRPSADLEDILAQSCRYQPQSILVVPTMTFDLLFVLVIATDDGSACGSM